MWWKDSEENRADYSWGRCLNQKTEINKSDHITTSFEILKDKRLLSLILRQKDGEVMITNNDNHSFVNRGPTKQ